jgi:uncharacterized damage-inducible protein DinB
LSSKAEHQEIIDGIRRLPIALEALLKNLDAQQLDAPGGEGNWTIRQVVHHMADANINFFARTKWIMTEDNPTLKLFDQEKWTALPDAVRSPIEPSLHILKGISQRWITLLENMPEESWARTAVHPELGEKTLGELLASYTNHGRVHLEQITQLRSSKGQTPSS